MYPTQVGLHFAEEMSISTPHTLIHVCSDSLFYISGNDVEVINLISSYLIVKSYVPLKSEIHLSFSVLCCVRLIWFLPSCHSPGVYVYQRDLLKQMVLKKPGYEWYTVYVYILSSVNF